jgi:hypothetical protein
MDNLLEQLSAQIHHAAHHAAEEAVGSPAAINRTVGESMRHIGQLLFSHSMPYLPVRAEEILVPPERLNSITLNAVVLVNRQMRSENAFTVLITSKGQGDDRSFDIVGYREDPFNLAASKFIVIPAEVGRELVRQANLLITGAGLTLLQAVVLKDFFAVPEATDPDAVATHDELFNSDLTPEVPVPTEPPTSAPTYDGKGLPPISEELL